MLQIGYTSHYLIIKCFSSIDCTLIRFDEKYSNVQLGYMYTKGSTPLYILNYDVRKATMHNATCVKLMYEISGTNVLGITKVFNYHSCHLRYSERNLNQLSLVEIYSLFFSDMCQMPEK